MLSITIASVPPRRKSALLRLACIRNKGDIKDQLYCIVSIHLWLVIQLTRLTTKPKTVLLPDQNRNDTTSISVEVHSENQLPIVSILQNLHGTYSSSLHSTIIRRPFSVYEWRAPVSLRVPQCDLGVGRNLGPFLQFSYRWSSLCHIVCKKQLSFYDLKLPPTTGTTLQLRDANYIIII